MNRYQNSGQGQVDARELSVVVQGLIVGKSEDERHLQHTKLCLESIRKYLPGAEVILSTWKRCDASGLDYDILVQGDEPERIDMMREDGSIKQMTVNNQIVSTNNGLSKVSRPYTLKIRSDMLITGTGFLKYFAKFNQSPSGGHFQRRIVCLTTYNPRKDLKFLFDPCDWLYFGLTEDLRALFAIPLMNENKLKGEITPSGVFKISDNLEAEQYIWINFLNKYENIALPSYHYCSPELIGQSELTYARDLIMLPAYKAGVTCLKMPHAGYGARPWLSDGLYTFTEYRKIYNRYNEIKKPFVPDLIEAALYFISYRLRKIIKRNLPGMNKLSIQVIRKIRSRKYDRI